jgi:hypothetical protein
MTAIEKTNSLWLEGEATRAAVGVVVVDGVGGELYAAFNLLAYGKCYHLLSFS